MIVWIVEGDDYEDQAVRSVWSTEELAVAEVERRGKMPDSERITYNDYTVDFRGDW